MTVATSVSGGTGITARGGTAYRWYVVVLLLLVYVLSYFDRYILSLLVEPIKHAMRLSDFQIGLLLGPAFSLFNVAVAIPIGWLSDRSSRKWVLIAGIVIWCAMTTASGFAMSFVPLLVLRLGLGLGEAVVMPCSVAIIADYFDRERRSRAISLYMAGPYLGAGLAFLVGGQLVGWLQRGHFDHLLGIGPFAPWQMAFIFVGVPGFLFALLMTSVREPERQDRLVTAAMPRLNAFRYIRDRWRGFGALFLGSTCNFAMSTLTLWNVPLFQRSWGWGIATVGTVTGLFYFTAGPIGTALSVWLARRLGRTHADAAMRILLIGLLITIPTSALYPMMPSAGVAVVLMFIAFVGKALATAGGPAALTLITPGEIRGQGIAIFNTIITLVGPLIGPPLIGWMTDASGDPHKLGMMISIFVAVVGVPSILFMILGMKHYRAALAELERALSAEAATRAR